MNHPIPTTNFHTSTGGVKKIQLVFACAWCPKTDYQPLTKNQAYTHGICSYHKRKLLKEYRNSEHSENAEESACRQADQRVRKSDGLTVRRTDTLNVRVLGK